ncbi:hypothetical protein GGI20_005639 [Coemansia sp. BCRC 34301]|nr:hypothetical protein GGI20_005639 [Coemansia sp. BCRC 34301]
MLCVLAVATICPNFTHYLPYDAHNHAMEMLEKTIDSRGFEQFDSRLRRLLFFLGLFDAAVVDVDSHPTAALAWLSDRPLLRHDYPCNVVWTIAGSLIVALIAITIIYERRQREQAKVDPALPESEKTQLTV